MSWCNCMERDEEQGGMLQRQARQANGRWHQLVLKLYSALNLR